MRYVGERHIVIDDRPAPVPIWSPDQSFADETVFIIGGGPSHAGIQPAALAGRRFVAVNSSCRKVRPIATGADLLYFSDNSWAERFVGLIHDWPGRAVTCNRRIQARLGAAVLRIDIIALTERVGALSDHVQASSGHIAACLALAMGARRIVLVGFESHPCGGQTHGHGDYVQPDPDAFAERFVPGWAGLAAAFERAGAEVLNATPGSAIAEFPMIGFHEALAL